jgi:hypothetical protein
MPSWSPSAVFSPREELAANLDATNLEFPEVSAGAELPVRPERHNPTSIATLHKELIVALVRGLQRCPCCQRTNCMGYETFDELIE